MRLRSGGVAGGLLEGRYDVSKALQRRCAGLDVVPKELQPWETAPPAPPQPKLCALDADAATLDFVAGARSKAASPFKLVMHSLLRWRMSHYDANAFLGVFPMHLLSPEQLGKLFSAAGAEGRQFERAIDVGAGDGVMTERLLRPLARRVHATETSARMAKLADGRRGVRCVHADISDPVYSDGNRWPPSLLPEFDLALLLNVLDRTSRPVSLLERVSQRLSPDGLLVVSTPLPLRQIWYDGPAVKAPYETLVDAVALEDVQPLPDDPDVSDWDRQANWFLHGVLPLFKLEPVAYARLPYMSVGDVTHNLVVYDDLCVVCKPALSSRI